MRCPVTLVILLVNLTKLKALESSLESVLIQMLGQDPCNLVLLDPNSGVVRNVVQQMETMDEATKPLIIFDDALLADAMILRSISKCLVGVTDTKTMDTLQDMLLSTFYRQLVGLVSPDIDVQLPNVSISVNKKHHPIMLLSESKGMVKQSLVCDKNIIEINIMRASGWIRKTVFDRLTFERKCSQDKHPLKGKSLVVSSYALPPYLHMGTDLEIKGGVTYDMVNVIAGHFGFFVTHLPYANWFIFGTNGTIGGSIAPVLFGQADFSLEQTTQHAYSLGSMTTTTYTQVMAYIERTPKPISQLWNISYSFDNATWLFLLITCLVVIVVLYITSKLEEFKDMDDELNTTSLYSAIEATLGILFQEFKTKKHSYHNVGLSAVVRFMWVIFSMFIVMAFSGNLKSSFVRQNYEDRTMTLNEMVDKDMPIYTSTELAEFFESTRDISPLNGRILCQARKKNSVFKAGPDYLTVVIDKVVKHGGAFAVNTHSLEFTRGEYLLSGSDLPLVAIPDGYVAFSMGMLFQSHDPRVEYFDVVIGWMTDSGIVDALFRKVLPYAALTFQDKVEENPLILEHFAISMLAALGGMLIAALAFVAEMGKICRTKK